MTHRRLRPITVYLEPEQLEALTKLSKRTLVPKAAYVREGVTAVLVRYQTPEENEAMANRVLLDREKDGRFIAEVRDVPGAMAYGKTPAEAAKKARAIAKAARR